MNRLANACQLLTVPLGADTSLEAEYRLSQIAAGFNLAEMGPMESFICHSLLERTISKLNPLSPSPTGVDPRGSVLKNLVHELTNCLKRQRRDSKSVSARVQEYYIRCHACDQEFSQMCVADALHISRRTVCRVLRDDLGMSFRDLVRETRIAHIDDLSESDLSRKEIAWRCGYSSVSQMPSSPWYKSPLTIASSVVSGARA